MSAQVHAMIGLIVIAANLAVGAWALVSARSPGRPPRALTIAAAAALGVLAVQILLGLDLWLRGASPAPGVRGTIHIGGPVLAVIIGLSLLVGKADPAVRARRYATACLLSAAAALVSYGIGEMG